MSTNSVIGLDFSAKELRVMVQSLGNCLATCQVHARTPDAPCGRGATVKAVEALLE